ncbi:MAG: AzlC family ABC transporter permease [Candidatus Rokubacteria bacterium]|nr:AzlC family ABC transporter permease [Candidatus Rokubacteria bacterium]
MRATRPPGAATDIWAGIRDGLLFLPLYLPFAISYAVTAKMMGVASWVIVVWSAAIYAGSAQLACLSAMASGAGLVELNVIALMANVRHGLVAMSIAPYLKGVRKRMLPAICFTVATSSPGLLWARARRGGPVERYALATQVCQWGQWVLFTIVGAELGALIPVFLVGAVLFAAPAAFLGMVMPMLRENLTRGLLVGLVAGVAAVSLPAVVSVQMAAITAALVGALASLLL